MGGLPEDARNIDIDILESLNKKHTLRIFTQKKDLKTLIDQRKVQEFHCFLIDLKKRNPKCYLLDKLLKPVFGVRKFMTDVLALRQFLKEFGPDIVQVEGVTPWGIITYFATRMMKKNYRVLVTRHTVDSLKIPFEYYGREKSWVTYQMSKLVYKNFFIRANSWNTFKWLIDSGAPKQNLVMIPVNLRKRCQFQPQNTKPNRQAFFSLSNIYPMKGLDVLIDAFAEVLKTYPKANLDLYGPDRNLKGLGSYQTFLLKKIEELGIGNAVTFKGSVPRDKVTDIMKQYAFNISSSQGETLNLVVAESASVSVPSIVTEYTGISHWVEKHQSGIVCQCTKENLRDSILMAIEMEDSEYQRMVGNCHNLYDDFTPQSIEKQLLATYELLMQRSE